MMDINQISVELIGASDLRRLAADLATDVWRPAIDTETVYREELTKDGIPGAVRVISLAVQRADGSESAYVIDLRETPARQVAEILSDVHAVGFNANFDEHALLLSGIEVSSWYDAMIADTVTRTGRTGVMWYRSLAQLSKLALNHELDGKGTTQTSYDAETDLSAEQIRYAGHDAVVTRRVADWVRKNVEEAALGQAVELENGARPFINAMMMNGVPFDLDGYLEEVITQRSEEIASLLETIAELTEARPLDVEPKSELTLFAHAKNAAPREDGDPRSVPNWNPNSKPELIEALNKWAADEVMAYTKKVHGEARPLDPKTDSTRKDDMSQIGGPLVSAILKLKKAAKEVTTYGKDLQKHHRNGRFFSRYKQGGLVATGRLASFNFNAQNLSKGMLSWMKPEEGNVFVYGDISQAELRFAAHYAGEESMVKDFASGEDFHLATVRIMNPDLDLETVSDNEMKILRTAAKAVNFGLIYGMGASALSKNLTVAGVETDKATAQGYIDAYFSGRPFVAEWLKKRGDYVTGLAQNMPDLDFGASMELYKLRAAADTKRKAMRKKLERFPTMEELAAEIWPNGPEGEEDFSDEELQYFWEEQAGRLAWAYTFEAPVLLLTDGKPFEFYSTNVSGRRRCFDIPMDEGKFDSLLQSVLLEMMGTRKPAGRAFNEEFASKHGLKIPGADAWKKSWVGARMGIVKAFEGRDGKRLRDQYIASAMERFGGQAMVGVFSKAASSSVKALVNRYKNHPIQSAVADVASATYATMMKELPKGAKPIISVHDSLTIECRKEDAHAVAEMLRDAVNDAMNRFCTTVVSKTDVDIRTSLSDDDVVYELDTDKPLALV